MNYSVVPVVPGVDLFTHSRSKFIHCRIWDKQSQKYLRRTTGKLTIEEAKQWTLENLSDLFQIQPTERGGGTNSVRKLLTRYIEYQRTRLEAGEIAKATFTCYEGISSHFMKWLPENGYKKIADIKRASFIDYALTRATMDGYARNTVNNEVMYIRMWWKWLQDSEIVSRPINIPKLKGAISTKVSGEPFAEGHLEAIKVAIDEFVADKNTLISDYNRQLFALYIALLEESGARQHEVHNLKWSNVKAKETMTARQRVINTMHVPHNTKRGYRQSVFKGTAFVKISELQKEVIGEIDKDTYVFRCEDENKVVDRSTFSRYWTKIMRRLNMAYTLHTFRAHRITQLILGGTETHMVARNMGLSPAQISKTYLRFTPAEHFENLVQKDIKEKKELKVLIERV